MVNLPSSVRATSTPWPQQQQPLSPASSASTCQLLAVAQREGQAVVQVVLARRGLVNSFGLVAGPATSQF